MIHCDSLMFQSEDMKKFDLEVAPLRPTPRDVLAVLCGPEEAQPRK